MLSRRGYTEYEDPSYKLLLSPLMGVLFLPQYKLGCTKLKHNVKTKLDNKPCIYTFGEHNTLNLDWTPRSHQGYCEKCFFCLPLPFMRAKDPGCKGGNQIVSQADQHDGAGKSSEYRWIQIVN